MKLTPLALETLGLIRDGQVRQINCGTSAWRIFGANPSVVGRLVSRQLAVWGGYGGETITITLTPAGEAAWAAATPAAPAAPDLFSSPSHLLPENDHAQET